jgi:hypothetical protein
VPLLLDRLAEPQNLRRLVVAFCAIVVVCVPLAAFALVQASRAIGRVETGRKVGSAITCAATSAVIDAGRATIKAGANVRPREFAQSLEELGLPSTATRKQLAEAAADAYALAISRAVVEQSGVRGVVRRDGTLDCAALRRAARIG